VTSLLHDPAAAELAAPHEHRHLVGEAREERRLLERRVTAPDDGHLASAEEEPVAGRAGAHAAPAELLLRLQPEPQGRCARGDDDGVGAVLGVADPDPERTGREVDAGRIALEDRGAESLRLVAELLHQVRPLDAIGESGVVLDVGRDHQLAHRDVAGDHERREVGASGVDGGREAGRPGADDGDLVVEDVGAFLAHGVGRSRARWDGGGHLGISLPPGHRAGVPPRCGFRPT
jgi:hypothetical protein